MRYLLAFVLLLTGCARWGTAPEPEAPSVTLDTLATDALWVGLSVTPRGDVWLGGTGGSAAVRPAGGAWRLVPVPAADTLQFRDAHAWSAREAVLLAIGSGSASRVVRTDDGGQSWQTTWTNPDPDAFYDCLAFWPDRPGVGFAFSDAVEGAAGFELPIVRTTDRGQTWTRVASDRVPPAREGEGGYASSGACAVAGGQGEGWIVTNGGPGETDRDRIFATADYGQTWTARDVPIGSPEGAAGLSTAAWADGARFAGLLNAIDETVMLRTADGGTSWTRLAGVGLDQVYGLAAQPGPDAAHVAASGPGGLSVSTDGGTTWRVLTDTELWTLAPHPDGGFLAAGRDGVVARVRL